MSVLLLCAVICFSLSGVFLVGVVRMALRALRAAQPPVPTPLPEGHALYFVDGSHVLVDELGMLSMMLWQSRRIRGEERPRC